MARQKNKYLMYVLIITHLLLIQVYHLCHVHIPAHDGFHDLIHNLHSITHEQHGHDDDDYHQHDHSYLHVNVDKYYLSIKKSSFAKQTPKQYFVISANDVLNLGLIFQLIIQTPPQSAPIDWQSAPLHGRSPPFHV